MLCLVIPDDYPVLPGTANLQALGCLVQDPDDTILDSPGTVLQIVTEGLVRDVNKGSITIPCN